MGSELSPEKDGGKEGRGGGTPLAIVQTNRESS
jgi:hypothetical protein